MTHHTSQSLCTLASRLMLALGASIALGPAALALPEDQALPEFSPKPTTWKTGLLSHGDATIWDKDFAAWTRDCQKNAKAAVAGNWKLMVRCTFAQCYAGGFLHELLAVTDGRDKLTDFAGNAACRYFQGASANQSGDDQTKWNSRYAFAWQHRASAGATAEPVHDFNVVTTKAYNALLDGDGPVPKHPFIDQEHPQYVAGAGVVPGDLKGGDDAYKLAVLFAGKPEVRHRNNVTSIRDVLMMKYGFKAENIHILYGEVAADGAVDGAPWKSSGEATAANLKKALTENAGFVIDRIKAIANNRALNDKTIKLFLWTTDHGTVDAPIVFGVDETTTGKLGTDVNLHVLAGDATTWMYDGGSGTNVAIIPQVEDLVGPAPLDSASSGYERLPFEFDEVDQTRVKPFFGLDFSVGHDLTGGKPDTGTQLTIGEFRDPAAQIYVKTADGNRELVAAKTLGLIDDLLGPVPVDNVSALMMEPGAELFEAGAPVAPLFYTLPDSARIWVIDPWHPAPPPGQTFKRYVFWDPAFDPKWPAALNVPGRLDGLAMYVNVNAAGRAKGICPPEDPQAPPPPPMPGMPEKGDLVHKPLVDRILFSVPIGDPLGGSGCTIYLYTNAQVRTAFTCDELGLLATDDVDALHAYAGNTPYRLRIDPEQNDESLPMPCPTDLDGDGQVNGADLGLLIAAWGTSCPSSDIDDNGVVDGADLAHLLAAWGPCP